MARTGYDLLSTPAATAPSERPPGVDLASAALRLAGKVADAAAAQQARDAAMIAELRRDLAAQTALVRQQAETLADQEHVFERASAAAGIGLWQCRLPCETLRWSAGVYDLFEMPHGSAVSRQATLACYTEEARRTLVAMRAEAIARRTSFTLESEIVTLRGSRRAIRISASVEVRAGQPVRLFGFKQDITDAKRHADRMRYQAEFDRMTGLSNRSVFDARLAEMPETGALLLIDLDGFKAINDAHGHAVGDACLAEAARRLRDACRAIDLVACIGGDEFAVLIGHDADGAVGEAIGQRIVRAMRVPFVHRSVSLHFGASVGVARAAQANPVDLFTRADAALYAAKAAGRGTVRMAPP